MSASARSSVHSSRSAGSDGGVRVGIGIGWTTLIAAEMIASSSGLGWMVINASSYLRTDVVMLGILLLGTIGYLLDLAIVTTQRLTVHWMGKG